MNDFKKAIAAAAILSVVGVMSAGLAFAQTGRDSSTSSSDLNGRGRLSQRSAKPTPNLDKKMENLRERANKEIDRRIAALTQLKERLSKIKRLSSDLKTSLSAQIQTEIDALNALKAKINADTDPTTLKADVKSIVLSYRIFALFIPKIHIVIGSSVALEAVDKLTSLSERLQTKITEAKNAGKDVATLEDTLETLKNKIASAKLKAQTAIDTVTPLTPEGFPGNKTSLQSARKSLQVAHADLKDARQAAHTIIKGLKSLGLNGEPEESTTSAGTPLR